MRRLFPWLIVLMFAFVGCAAPSGEDGAPADDSADSAGANADGANADGADADGKDAGAEPMPADDGEPAPAADGEPSPAADSNPAPADDGEPAAADDGADPPADGAASNEVELTPANTKIQFVGTHTDPEKPDPRTGTFGQFSGTATVEGGKLTAVSVTIQTESLSTEIEKLTNHLKSPDFFAVKQFPQATFKSTKIGPAGDGTMNITGDLTLLATTKSITFPATVTTDGGLKLSAEFIIDRTEFGMEYGQDGVKKEVAMTVTVGK